MKCVHGSFEYVKVEELTYFYSYIAYAILSAGTQAGRDVIIDASNLTVLERKFWINIGQQDNEHVRIVEFVSAPADRLAMRKIMYSVNKDYDHWLKAAYEDLDKYEEPDKVTEGFDSHAFIDGAQFLN
jgi:hypothetical protein